MSRYLLSAEVEADDLGDAWNRVSSLPSSFASDQIDRFEHIKRFDLVEVARRVQAEIS